MTFRFERGLVVGKFVPPHRGHLHLIDAARSACETVTVVVCDRPGQRPPSPTRASWLTAVRPDVTVRIVADICDHGADPCPAECSPRWAEHLTALGVRCDAVFSSEDYGAPFAAALGAESVLVDRARTKHPVSGTGVRSDPAATWVHLHPVVRAGLTRRVVVLGVESSGTTTLSRDLAQALGSALVAEFGRWWSEQLAGRFGGIEAVQWTATDFEHILAGQRSLESSVVAAQSVDERYRPDARLGPLVVCDTDELATTVWEERYLGAALSSRLGYSVEEPLCRILTSPAGVPFEQDGLRDGEHLRGSMHERFRHVTAAATAPTLEVVGKPETRLRAALTFVHRVAASSGLFDLG